MSGRQTEIKKKMGRPKNEKLKASSFYKPETVWLLVRQLMDYAATLELNPSAAAESPQDQIQVRAAEAFLKQQETLRKSSGGDPTEYFFLDMQAKDLATAIKLSYADTGNEETKAEPIKKFCKFWDFDFKNLWPTINTPPKRFPIDKIKKDYYNFAIFVLAEECNIVVSGKTIRKFRKRLPEMVKLYNQDPVKIVEKELQRGLALSAVQTEAVMTALRSTNYDWRCGVSSESVPLQQEAMTRSMFSTLSKGLTPTEIHELARKLSIC